MPARAQPHTVLAHQLHSELYTRRTALGIRDRVSRIWGGPGAGTIRELSMAMLQSQVQVVENQDAPYERFSISNGRDC